MNSVREVQQARLLEKFERELGEQACQGLADPAVTDLIVNRDGHLWFDAHGKGMWDTGCVIPATQVESLIGTVAALLNMVVNAQSPIIAAVAVACSQRCNNGKPKTAAITSVGAKNVFKSGTSFSRKPRTGSE